jgi:hypothetical protein
MGKVEGQDGGGRGRAGSIYMFDDRGARKNKLVNFQNASRDIILLLVIYIDGINLAAHGGCCLMMGSLGVDCIAMKLPVLPPTPAFC